MHIQIQASQVQERAQAASDAAMITSYAEQRRSIQQDVPSFEDESSSSEDSSENVNAPQQPRSSQRTSSRRHRSRDTATEPLPTPPASTAAIMGLTHIRVFADDKVTHKTDDRCCSVCSDRLVDGVVLTRLPCGHIYHISCIVPWLNRNCTCPDCRYELPTADKKFEEGRKERMKDRKLASCGCSAFGFHSCVFPTPAES